MIVRGKSASGMVRWNIDSAKDPLLILSQHVSDITFYVLALADAQSEEIPDKLLASAGTANLA